jgi:poly(beta-D-mannuronate) lyase
VSTPFGGRRFRAVVIALVAALVGGLAALGQLAIAGRASAEDGNRIHPVASVAELRTAVAVAQPGDRIELADGVYDLTTTVELKVAGTAEAPVTIAAANVGKATIAGTAALKINASYVVVEGLTVTNAVEFKVPATASNVRLTRNTFQLAGSVKNWVSVYGDYAEIDHNTFQNKSTIGVFLQISGPGDTGMARGVRVHHNLFTDHSYADGNGGEAIRLGLSSRQQASASAVVEYNVFTRVNGDREAISVKSSDNVIRFNRIEQSYGTITLRHGNRNRVEGNILVGGSAGIRVFGDDHVVINNVVQGSDRSPLEIGGGDVRDETGYGTGYDAADRVVVAANSFLYNAAQAANIGVDGRTYQPTAITVANNILVGASDTDPASAARVGVDTQVAWSANLVHDLVPGVTAEGAVLADPMVVADATGLFRPTVDSPAVGAAAAAYDVATEDMDGQPRPAVATIGADEPVSTPALKTAPLAGAVGPTA